MTTSIGLLSVVKVDSALCVNCHKCISVCPVKYCNDGSKDYVTINPDTCIGCGACIAACTHDARLYVDDFQKFINDIIAGERMVAVVAPSVAASFPEQYLQLNGMLKEMGIEAIFDVSFGAELTVQSYLEHIQENKPKTVIAQPCPAIVNYIEIYKPELIKYLAPADSPILHTIKMIKRYYPEYQSHKIAIISPCVAKKREFEETGLGDYNVAMLSLEKFIKENNVDLSGYEPSDYDNPPAERAVMFSSPGGLLQTVRRYIPDIDESTRKIEGTELIYHYLNNLESVINEGKAPLLVDCLSCENGCNQGPVTLTQNQSPDETEYHIKQRAKKLKDYYLESTKGNRQGAADSIESILNQYYEPGLYKRTYVNRWQNNTLKYPNKPQVESIYKDLLKDRAEDIQNCAACGYGTCEGMAIAIFNGLNQKENCHLYRIKISDQSLMEATRSKAKTESIIQTAQDGFVEVDTDMRIVATNEATKKILKKSDIVGRSLTEFLDESNKKILKKEIENRKKGKKSSYEIQFSQSDGKPVCTLVSASPLRDINSGKITGSFAIITDISKLKDSEKKLRDAKEHLEERVKERTTELNEILEEVKQQNEEILTQKEAIEDSEKRLFNILDMLPNAVFILDAAGRISFWNQQIEDMTGIPASEILGKGNCEYAIPFYGKRQSMLIDLLQADDDELKKQYSNVQRLGNILRVEAYVPALKGNKRFLIAAATALYDSDNNYAGAIEVIEDITEQQQQKEKIEQQSVLLKHQANIMEEILAESEKDNETIQKINKELSKLSIAVSKTENAIMIMDKDGNFEWTNRAFEKAYGMDLEHLKKQRGKNIKEAIAYRNINAVFKQVTEKKKSRTFVYKEKNAKNESMYVQTTLSPIVDEKNDIRNLVAINTDVSEMKRAEEILTHQKKEIENQRDILIEKNTEIELQNERIKEHRDILTAQKKEITDSIAYAQRIQNAVIPNNNAFDPENTLVFFKPRDIVSGDFYYFNETPAFKAFAAVDCTGHGVPGAFMSMLGISFLNEILKSDIKTAAEVLEKLRTAVKSSLRQNEHNNRQKDGMDIALCLIDKKSNILHYSGAYNPLIIIRKGEIIEYKGVRNPIGIYMREKAFQNIRIKTQKGDMLYLYSDGYTDQFGGQQGRKFTKKRLHELLPEIASLPVNEQYKILEDKLTKWKGTYEQTDDIIITAVRI